MLKEMSVTKAKSIDFRNIDILTGVNTAGIIYLYYALNSLGSNLNSKIVKITTVLKRLNRNTNVTDAQLKRHIIETSLNPIQENIFTREEMDRIALDEEFKNEVLMKLQNLDKRLSIIETINNPLVTKYSKDRKDISPVVVANNSDEKTPVIW